MALITLNILLFLLCATINGYQTCERLEKKSCLGMQLTFNFTTTAIANDSKDQNEVEENLEKWRALSFLPRCWEVLHPLLCRVYKPECDGGGVGQLPCRSHCIKTRAPCSVVEKFEQYGGWPDFLKCDAFPVENCENIEITTINKTNCPSPLVNTENEDSWYEGIHGCGIQCENPIFTKEEHDRIHLFIGAFGTLSILCTSFTVLTFLAGWKTQSKYPSIVLFYMNACFCLTFLGFLLQFFGNSRRGILCRADNTMRLREPRGPDSAACIATFFLVYYFSMAGVVWFVVLSYAWFICFKGLGTTQDNLSSKAVFFHIAAWLFPFILTVVIIALSQVDGNSLSGVCFVGYSNMKMRIYFLLAPLGISLSISGMFLAKGLFTLVKLRKTNPHFLSQRSSSRIRETIVRVGIFAFLSFIFMVTTFACHLYDYYHQKIWENGYREYMRCIADQTIHQGRKVTKTCKPESRPDLGIIELQLFSLFGAGITMSAWTWTSNTLSGWKTAWDRLKGRKRYPELSHYKLIRRMRQIRKMQAAVSPSPVGFEERQRGRTPSPIIREDEPLQLQSVVSEPSASVICEAKLPCMIRR